MNIHYDIPIKVSKTQFTTLMTKCAGIVAGRKDTRRQYGIKVWYIQYKQLVQNILETIK